MAIHVKIKTVENYNVHIDTLVNNYTLCGLETGGDNSIGIEVSRVTNRKVNCPQCIGIINFCKKIKRKEYKP